MYLSDRAPSTEELPVVYRSQVISRVYIIKIKMHSSCEIEYFVETHLCKQAVCDSPIARVTGRVSSLRI